MKRTASDGASSTSPTVAHTAGWRASDPPSSTTPQSQLYEACPSAPGTQGATPNVARGGSDVTTSASALQFTCCRCRRSLVVRPGMQRSSAPVLSSLHESASVSRGAMTFVEGPQPHSPRFPSPASSVQRAVRDSHATRGAGRLFRPLEPPATAVGEEVCSVPCDDTCDALASIPAAVTSTGIFEERHGVDCRANTQFADEALLNVLPPHYFSSAELLTSSQLADLLSHAEGTCAAAATTSMCAETTSTSSCPLTSSPLPTAVNTVASSLAATVPSEGTVLGVWQLASLGVPVRSTATRRVGEAEDAKDHLAIRSGASLHESVYSTQEANSSTVDDAHSDLSAAPADEHGGARTETCPQMSPQAYSTCTLLPPPHDRREACEVLATPSSATSAALRASPTHTLAVDQTFASLPPCSLRPPFSSTPRPPAPAPTSHVDPDISAETPLCDPSTAVPFDELCRRWMRLLARTAAPHEQPLCMDCWRDASLAPLQQRARRSLDGAKTLAAMIASSPAEKRRLFAMCYAELPRAPLLEAGVTSACLRRHGDEVEDRQVAASKATSETLDRSLPLMSLDAVAANVFGSEEEGLLHSLEALSVPHRSLPNKKGSATAQSALQCTPDPSLEQRGASAVRGDEDTLALPSSCCDAAQMMADLERLLAEQASLDRQVSELREELHALESATDPRRGGEGQLGEAFAAPPLAVMPKGWQELAVAHNIREVQRAFTVGDEAAERQRAMDDLVARFAYVSSTPIDDLCFPIDVSGPVGLIAGLRLGLVLPYSGPRSGRVGAGDGGGASAESATPTRPPLAHASLAVSEESMHLRGFVDRQVSYTQLLLSGNTSADGSDGDTATEGWRNSGSGVKGGPWSGGAAATAATPASTAPAKVGSNRVSPLEVNAACGYLLLLLNYLAHVNGFSFRTALLRPAGDRSTLALLKRVPAPVSVTKRGGDAVQATSSSLSPLSIFTYLTRKSITDTPPSGSSKSTRAMATPSSAYVVDHEVDFYLTDRLLAWRTFGTACVAVASCVKELADALHESLRCWRVRESMMCQRAPSGSPTPLSREATEALSGTMEAVKAASHPATLPVSADVSGSLESRSNADLYAACTQQRTPAPLPQLVQDLFSRHGHLNSAENRESCTAPQRDTVAPSTLGKSNAPPAEGNGGLSELASASPPLQLLREASRKQCCSFSSAEGSKFPLQPPFRTRGDTVDGFSVRHGSVSEAIWTLGMKKLLANVRWCMEATGELERLYAVTGEAGVDGADDEVDEDGADAFGEVRTIPSMSTE
ncbi:hypothetical protein GH5_07543 [Leishmania sp. Ghana 2012 LV757]|uniref:hypothetical protein n=1 Tax=Leishmania sp. Ghana 2012 LV757 TaxID=2803181 RepID=UPI001B70DDD1|nr:hypothetical protein GH5_07543 [Leishmania sp. Ghana 2012 LV757]